MVTSGFGLSLGSSLTGSSSLVFSGGLGFDDFLDELFGEGIGFEISGDGSDSTFLLSSLLSVGRVRSFIKEVEEGEETVWIREGSFAVLDDEPLSEGGGVASVFESFISSVANSSV